MSKVARDDLADFGYPDTVREQVIGNRKFAEAFELYFATVFARSVIKLEDLLTNCNISPEKFEQYVQGVSLPALTVLDRIDQFCQSYGLVFSPLVILGRKELNEKRRSHLVAKMEERKRNSKDLVASIVDDIATDTANFIENFHCTYDSTDVPDQEIKRGVVDSNNEIVEDGIRTTEEFNSELINTNRDLAKENNALKERLKVLRARVGMLEDELEELKDVTVKDVPLMTLTQIEEFCVEQRRLLQIFLGQNQDPTYPSVPKSWRQFSLDFLREVYENPDRFETVEQYQHELRKAVHAFHKKQNSDQFIFRNSPIYGCTFDEMPLVNRIIMNQTYETMKNLRNICNMEEGDLEPKYPEIGDNYENQDD